MKVMVWTFLYDRRIVILLCKKLHNNINSLLSVVVMVENKQKVIITPKITRSLPALRLIIVVSLKRIGV